MLGLKLYSSLQVPTCCSCHIMGYSYVYPPLKKGAEQSPASHGPPGSGSSQLNLPPQRPLPNSQDSFQSPPQSSRPAPQLTPDSFPGPQQDLDNFIPDFNPQEELQAFMQSIGDDFKDFNFGKSSRPARNNQVNQVIFLSIFFYFDDSSVLALHAYQLHLSHGQLLGAFNPFQEI